MTAPAIQVRRVLRWWPVVVVTMLLAIGAALVGSAQRSPSYTATTRLVVIPLVQWDETFLGISLVRDSGDAGRTSATVAERLDSRRVAPSVAEMLGGGWTPQAVQAAVEVRAVSETNLVEVVARSDEPATAVALAEWFAVVAIADRWRTISAELDQRIELLSRTTAADPNAGEASQRLQQLRTVREGGSDPTLQIESTGPAERVVEASTGAVVGLAAAGGLFVGVLAAVGLARIPRRAPAPTGATPTDIEERASPPAPAELFTPVSSRS